MIFAEQLLQPCKSSHSRAILAAYRKRLRSSINVKSGDAGGHLEDRGPSHRAVGSDQQASLVVSDRDAVGGFRDGDAISGSIKLLVY